VASLLLGLPSGETWFYGRTVEWSNPFTREFPWITSPMQLKLRIFSAGDGDVSISFNRSGKVIRVEIPP
jgi:hypothetical protein